MPFVKGTSGNPSGRPKSDDEIKRLILEHVKDPAYFVKKLKGFVESAEDDKTRFSALKLMIEYVYGCPRRNVDITGSIEMGLGAMLEDLAKSRADLRKLA